MSSTTTNYDLIKPDGTDPANIQDINDNMDSIDTVMKNLEDAINSAQTLLNTLGTIPIANGGTGATTAAGAKANIVDGQALAPASISATGAIQGTSISDGTGTLAQLRESVSSMVSTNIGSTITSDTTDATRLYQHNFTCRNPLSEHNNHQMAAVVSTEKIIIWCASCGRVVKTFQ